MINIDKACKAFNKELVLNNLSLNIDKGENVSLIGENGAGKTTLVRTLLGFYSIDSGTIRVNNLDPRVHRKEVLHNIAFVPQLPPPILFKVKELMKFTSTLLNISIDSIVQIANLFNLDINHHGNKTFFSLSGGMKQKMLLSIALARDNSILILDEPVSNLDTKSRTVFYDLMLKKRDKTFIIITHGESEIKNITNRRVYMQLGEVIKDEKN